ncbi:MAG TPA: hypothetical protein VF680_16800 [Allosphingosinicella sp.]|jgi:hypothetical protein
MDSTIKIKDGQLQNPGGNGNGQTIIQDNRFILKNIGTIDTDTPVNVAAAINSLQSFVVTEHQIPIFNYTKRIGENTQVVDVILLMLGKGTYGSGGTVVTVNNVKVISRYYATTLNIEELINTQKVDLGDIGALSISQHINENDSIFIQDQADGYVVFKAIINGLEKSYLYLGPGGDFGLDADTILQQDFQPLYAEIEQTEFEIPSIDEVISQGGNTTSGSVNFTSGSSNVTFNNGLGYTSGMNSERVIVNRTDFDGIYTVIIRGNNIEFSKDDGSVCTFYPSLYGNTTNIFLPDADGTLATEEYVNIAIASSGGGGGGGVTEQQLDDAIDGANATAQGYANTAESNAIAAAAAALAGDIEVNNITAVGSIDAASVSAINNVIGSNITATNATDIATLQSGKVDKVTGKGLSTEDYTTVDKDKVSLLSGTNSGNETATTIGTLVNGATSKTTPVDADMIPLMDSAASNIIKKLSWANVKATLKTYFDTLYATVADLANLERYFYRSITPSTITAGTTTPGTGDVVMRSITIAPNTFAVGSLLKASFNVSRTASNLVYAAYYLTTTPPTVGSSPPVGSTQVGGFYTSGASELSFIFSRVFVIKSDGLHVNRVEGTGAVDNERGSTIAAQIIPFNPSTTYYLMEIINRTNTSNGVASEASFVKGVK